MVYGDGGLREARAAMDAPSKGDRPADPRLLGPLKDATGASSRLLGLLASELLKLFRDKELPSEIKLLLIPLLFMIPLYSVVLVIFCGHLTYCVVGRLEMIFYHYLIFLGTTGPPTLIIFLLYGLIAGRFEAARHLEMQLQSVTETRAPRRRRPTVRNSAYA
jgi:hypothetical protein